MTDQPFQGHIGQTYQESTPWWPDEPQTAGRPNILMIVLDDLGFGSLGCYGSEIATPNIDRLAARGVQFTNFHATALCSPTRASLLTGRNNHRVGMAYLSHVDDGYPGYRGRIGHDAATLAEMLGDAGWNCYAVGKWHLAPMDTTTAAGPYDQWPLGRGFERYYGFLEGLTDHYYPELFADNHPIDPPAAPEDGYHLSEDLVDQAMQMITDQTSVAPEKPFFCYLAFGATHTPHQAPAEYVNAYRGRYDDGWDVIRQFRHARQLLEDIIPPGTKLPEPNADVQAWDGLPAEAKHAYARFQEVFAGFLTHTDEQIGRLLDHLNQLDRLDDTIVIVVSDNGASQEGGPHGVINTTHYENGRFPDLTDIIDAAETIDGRTTQVNYPLGWAQAGNTPLKRYKQNTHAGGIRTPMIMTLAKNMITEASQGTRRHAFTHVTDVVPTLLELADVTPAAERNGITQLPLDGRSMVPLLTDVDHDPGSRTQYFETLGNRAIWKDGWKAVAFHQRGTDYSTDRWELYHIDQDFSECDDLAEAEPERLDQLVQAWWDEAARNHVLPLDDRGFAQRANARFRPHSPRDRTTFTYWNGMSHLGTGATVPTPGRPFRISAEIDITADAEGTLFTHGSWSSGYGLFIVDQRLQFDYNYYGDHTIVTSPNPLPAQPCTVSATLTMTGEATSANITLHVDDQQVAQQDLPETFEYFVAFEGMDVGTDGLSPVRENGIGPFPYAGKLDKVVVELLDPDTPYQGR